MVVSILGQVDGARWPGVYQGGWSQSSCEAYGIQAYLLGFPQLGQWAASRTDIFPPELCSIMSSLHSNAPAHPLRETKKIIRKAFSGLPFDRIFEEFHEEPLGVGAIAQVYKAKLKRDLATAEKDLSGSEPQSLRRKVKKNVDVLVKSSPQRVPSSYVAVKVLHPKVERVIRRDLRS